MKTEFVLPEEFTYEYALDHRYNIPKIKIGKFHYEMICSNGFIKLYTLPCRLY